MIAEERATRFAEAWSLGIDTRQALVELLHQHADECLSNADQELRRVAQTYDRVTEKAIVGAGLFAIGSARSGHERQ